MNYQWHLPLIGQFAHPHEQEETPAFLFLKCLKIIRAATPNTNAATIIVPRLLSNQDILFLLFSIIVYYFEVLTLTLSLSASLYGLASINTTKAITARAKINPITFRLPVKIEPIWKITRATAYARTH